MEFTKLKVACKSCPFRREDTSGPKEMGPVRLRVGRVVDLHNTLTTWHGGTFSCHKTVDYEAMEEDDCEGPHFPRKGEHHCAGALGYLANLDSDGAQVTKFAVYHPGGTYAEYGPPEEMFSSLSEMKQSCDDYDDGDGEIETCGTVNAGCIAPAGYLNGGDVVEGTESADCVCEECGDPVCSECITEDGKCGSCGGWEENNY
jgi:hypothetical protein